MDKEKLAELTQEIIMQLGENTLAHLKKSAANPGEARDEVVTSALVNAYVYVMANSKFLLPHEETEKD